MKAKVKPIIEQERKITKLMTFCKSWKGENEWKLVDGKDKARTRKNVLRKVFYYQ